MTTTQSTTRQSAELTETADRSSTRDGAPARPYLASLLLATVVVYTIAADWAPEPVVSILPLAIGGLSLLTAVRAFAYDRANTAGVVLVSLMFLATVVLAKLGHPQNWDALTRYLIGLGALFSIPFLPGGDPRRWLTLAAYPVIWFAAGYAAVKGLYTYAGTERLWPYWENLANSSTILVGFLLLLLMSDRRSIPRLLTLLVGTAVLVGYGVVTPILAFGLYLVGRFLLRRGGSLLPLVFVAVPAVAVGLAFRNSFSSDEASVENLGSGALGSGRIDSWAERMNIFWNSDLLAQFIGGGAYSDYRTTELWWWQAKNAHSDIITVLMEFGVVGLVALVIAGVLLCRRCTRHTMLVFLCIGFAAMCSNPFLDRPSVCVVWGAVLYCARWAHLGRQPDSGDDQRSAPVPVGRLR